MSKVQVKTEELRTIQLAFITIGGLIAGVVTAISILIYDGFDMLLSHGVTTHTINEYVVFMIPYVVVVNLICMAVAFLIYRRLMQTMG